MTNVQLVDGDTFAGAGVREGGDIPAGAAAGGRGARTRRLLHPPLRGHVREGGYADSHVRDPAPGGEGATVGTIIGLDVVA